MNNYIYTSSACNRVPTAADWGKNNLICYGSCNAIQIYDPRWGSGGKIVKTLAGHKNRVNSVRWISGICSENETELVSGSSDGTAIVWSYRNGNYVSCSLEGHRDTINRVGGCYKSGYLKDTVVITASSDCTIKVWSRITINDGFVQSQSINLGQHICTGFNITCILAKQLLLACGLDNSKVYLYVESDEENEGCKFDSLQILSGPEDWVESLDFKLKENGDLLLAVSSLDSFVRIWTISPVRIAEHEVSDNSILKYSLIRKDIKVTINNATFIISSESPLGGHIDRVYSVNWNPKSFTLLTASQDKSIIIWQYDTESEVWLENTRLGEVGGNTLGFYGGTFGPDGNSIMAYGYHGSFHIWNFCEELNMWQPATIIGGHFEEVVDLAWEPKGEFLISVSTDMTTRIHAPWCADEKPITWHEIARPQVHGYSMNSIALLSRYKFASSAQEKVIRVFNAPWIFIGNFKNICKIPGNEDELIEVGPKGAAVPSLGLSNKAVFENDNSDKATAKSNKEPYPEESHFTAVHLNEPPTEETLMQNTLWPEIQKLYGHGYEVYSLAANPDGSILASACKSTSTEHAAILIWDTSNWKILQKLISHNLTVVQLSFSPNSKCLLSVSRDRRWSLFQKNTNIFEQIATTDKATGIHTRIIWCCAWSADSQYFATGSRDGKVVVWTRNENKIPINILGQYEAVPSYLELKGESVTAVAFAPIQLLDSYLLSIGLESGCILLYKWKINEWSLHLKFNNSIAHHLTVRKLAFRPLPGEGGSKHVDKKILQLASCGADHAVKVHSISNESTYWQSLYFYSRSRAIFYHNHSCYYPETRDPFVKQKPPGLCILVVLKEQFLHV